MVGEASSRWLEKIWAVGVGANGVIDCFYSDKKAVSRISPRVRVRVSVSIVYRIATFSLL